jgi:hypothetical protein
VIKTRIIEATLAIYKNLIFNFCVDTFHFSNPS